LGEIYVRSPHLSKGYKGLPDQTNAKFLRNPLRDDPKDRTYRTGDLGRYTIDGCVDVLGRCDNQVKIRGFRIELGEINSMLRQDDSIVTISKSYMV
jgi:non-ribosomal peptide synthetase component F